MSRPNLKAVSLGDPPPRSTQRMRLAEAIIKRDDLKRELAETEAALDAAHTTVTAVTAAVAEKVKQLEQAKEAGVNFAALAALGKPGTTPPASVQDVRAALTDAQDKLDAAKAAAAMFENNHKITANELYYAEGRVDDATRDAVKADSRIRDLVAAYAEAQNKFLALQNACEAMQSNMPDDIKFWRANSDQKLTEVRAAEWKAACEALKTDADAELPSS